MVTWLLQQACGDLAGIARVRSSRVPPGQQPALSLRCCCCALGNFSLEQGSSSLCYGSCPSLDKQTASRLQGPLQYPHSPCGDELVPCWLGITVLPPFPSQSSEPPVAMFLPQSPLAFAQLTLKTKVPLMPLGVAQFRHRLPQGYGIQGQPLWQVFAKAQGDLHFFLSVHQPEPLPAQWNLAWSAAGSRTSPEGLPSLPHLAQRTGV